MGCGRHGFLILVGASAIGAGGGCGNEPPLPSLLADRPIDASSSVDATASFAEPATAPPMCNLGPEGGVCACVDQPLVVDAPTMYFALDTSGSMSDDNKWRSVQLVVGNLVTAIGPRAKFGAATFPNERSTAGDGCALGTEVFAPTEGDPLAGTEGPTAQSLLSVLGAIPARGGTPTAAPLASLTPHLLALPGTTYLILATDGGPNCDAAVACDAGGCEPNIEADDGCSTNGPNCCAPANGGTYESCLDGQATINAVKALAAGGIPVYVVGAPGSEPYAELLDELAQAGGTARGGEPQYYAVSTATTTAFTAAISSIAAKITGSCTLQLNQVPPDPDLVNVFLNEQVLAASGADGWTLSGTTVTILGSSCTEILNGDVLDVRVVAGCPTQLK